jgi:hypothetical protein
MTGIEYQDLRKFIASIGVAMIAFSLFLYWLVLKEPFDLQIKSDDIKLLTPTAQKIIEHRQEAVSDLIWYQPQISVVFFFLGLAVLLWALFEWKEKQQMTDQMEKMEFEQVLKKFRPLDDKEIDEKVDKETADNTAVEEANLKKSAGIINYVLNAETGRFNVTGQPVKFITVPKKETSDSFRSRYREIEEKIFFKLGRFQRNNFFLMTDSLVVGTAVDALLVRKQNNIGSDCLVEIKYLKSTKNKYAVTAGLARLQITVGNYSNYSKRKAKGLLIVVFKDGQVNTLTKPVENTWVLEICERDLDTFDLNNAISQEDLV